MSFEEPKTVAPPADVVKPEPVADAPAKVEEAAPAAEAKADAAADKPAEAEKK